MSISAEHSFVTCPPLPVVVVHISLLREVIVNTRRSPAIRQLHLLRETSSSESSAIRVAPSERCDRLSVSDSSKRLSTIILRSERVLSPLCEILGRHAQTLTEYCEYVPARLDEL